jgi:hypothetical protein
MLLLEGVSFNPAAVAYTLPRTNEEGHIGCTVLFLNDKVLHFTLTVEEFTDFVNNPLGPPERP